MCSIAVVVLFAALTVLMVFSWARIDARRRRARHEMGDGPEPPPD